MCKIVDVIMILLLCIATIGDWKRKTVTVNLLLWMSGVAVFAALILRRNSWKEVALGLLIGLFFLILSKLTEEQIGYGDSWLIGILGVYLGGTDLMVLILAASFTAGIVSLIYCSAHRWSRRHELPFIPFLTMAFVGVCLL